MERVTNLPCPPPNTSTGSTPALCRPPIVPRTTLSSHTVHRLSLASAASGRECIEGGSSGKFDNPSPPTYKLPLSIRSDSGNRIRQPGVGDGKVP
jgi:hypothetical protein